MSAALEAYVAFITEQLERAKEVIKIVDDLKQMVTPLSLNTALGYYTEVCTALNTECRRKTIELENLRLDMTAWMGKNTVDLRKQFVIDLGKTAAYKVSKAELEDEVRSMFPHEYRAYREKEIELEAIVAWCERALHQLSRHESILTQTGQNLRTEVRSLGLEVRLNKAMDAPPSTATSSGAVPIRAFRRQLQGQQPEG